MTKNLDLDGLQSIADNYDLFYIDLWGVIHNGIKLHYSAIATLNELKKKNKSFVLLTNAPRPNSTVNKFLEKMGMSEDLREHVFTSGEAALKFLKTSASFLNVLNSNTFPLGSFMKNVPCSPDLFLNLILGFIRKLILSKSSFLYNSSHSCQSNITPKWLQGIWSSSTLFELT